MLFSTGFFSSGAVLDYGLGSRLRTMSRMGDLTINVRTYMGKHFQEILPINLVPAVNGHGHWPQILPQAPRLLRQGDAITGMVVNISRVVKNLRHSLAEKVPFLSFFPKWGLLEKNRGFRLAHFQKTKALEGPESLNRPVSTEWEKGGRWRQRGIWSGRNDRRGL